MDHASWLDRLRVFVANWQAKLPPERYSECYIHTEPVLTPDQIARLQSELGFDLPLSVRLFLTRACSRLRLQCVCLPHNHAEIVCSLELFDYWVWSPGKGIIDDEQFGGPLHGLIFAREAVRSTADKMGSPECVLDRAFWYHALPLTFIPSGDGLALWAYDPGLTEPPVFWLDHEDTSFLLAHTFDSFAEEAEMHRFIAIAFVGAVSRRKPRCTGL